MTQHRDSMAQTGSPLLLFGRETGLEADAARLQRLSSAVLDSLEAHPDCAQFTRISQAFSLSFPEQALLALSVARYASLQALPGGEERLACCRRLGWEEGKELSFLFSTSFPLLAMACGIILGRSPQLPPFLRLAPVAQMPYHSHSLAQNLSRFAGEEGPVSGSSLVVLYGAPGSGRHFLLSRFAQEKGCLLLQADCRGFGQEEVPFVAGVALLLDAILCLDSYQEGQEPVLEELFGWFSLLTMVRGERLRQVPRSCTALLERSPQPLTPAQRVQVMEEWFPGIPAPVLTRAAHLYRMNIGRLQGAAVRFAGREWTEEALFQVLREENAPALSQSAQLLSTNKRMEDLVLPEESLKQVRRLCDFARVRDTVWREWDFADKVPYGRGIAALFYGASGTGKTLAASIVANELGLELYRVDLSQLISKYIGETQKNIGQVFDGAANADCILFFDEADALFSRRSDASDAQDRYANAETAYLLQRTEQYDGIILMATNLLQNFDEAFRRRIGFMIHFPLPDAALREQLWRGIFPGKAPLEELDYGLLARELELSGAGIRSCAVSAASLAAAQQEKITMGCIVEAARMEYQKQGKPFPAHLAAAYPAGRRSL